MHIMVDGRILKKNGGGIKVATINILKNLYKTHTNNISFFNITEEEFPQNSLDENEIKFSKNISDDTIVWAPNHKILKHSLTNVPVVLSIHDMVWKKHSNTMNWRTRLGEQLFFSHSVKRANKIVCVSKNTANDLCSYYPKACHKAEVVYLGANKPKKLTSLKFSPFALFVGTFEPRKNLERLFKAISLLDNQVLNGFKFIFAGNQGWGGIDIERLKIKYNLGDLIEIIYNPDNELIQKYYMECKFLLLPSLYEGFGLPVIEAMHFGKPALVSKNSSLIEVAGQAGHYIDPIDISSIKNGLELMINNETYFQEIQKHTFQQAEQFTWEKTASKMYEIFTNTLNTKINS